MKRRRPSLILLSLLSTAAILSAGCQGTYVATAARSSFSSFITTVFTTGVNEAINPSDD